MKDTTIAVGLAKNVFEIAISREAGKVSQATPCESTQVGVVFLRNRALPPCFSKPAARLTSGQGRCDGWDTTSSCSPSCAKTRPF